MPHDTGFVQAAAGPVMALSAIDLIACWLRCLFLLHKSQQTGAIRYLYFRISSLSHRLNVAIYIGLQTSDARRDSMF